MMDSNWTEIGPAWTRSLIATKASLESFCVLHGMPVRLWSTTRRHRLSPWHMGLEEGLRAEMRGVGVVYVPSEGCITNDGSTLEISLDRALQAERDRQEAMMNGHAVPVRPDPLRKSPGFIVGEPFDIRAIVIDPLEGEIRTDPDVGVEPVRIQRDMGPSRMLADEDSMFRFLREVFFLSLGIVEAQTIELTA